MSDAEFEEDEEPEEVFEELTLDKLKTAQDIIDYLSDVIYDRWYNGLIGSQASPWASANDFARYITSFARSGIVDDSSLISALAEASGLDYNTFKRLWDRLPRNRKVSLLNLIAYDVALGGFAKFMESLTNTLKNYDEKVRKQVAEAASKYLKADLLPALGRFPPSVRAYICHLEGSRGGQRSPHLAKFHPLDGKQGLIGLSTIPALKGEAFSCR